MTNQLTVWVLLASPFLICAFSKENQDDTTATLADILPECSPDDEAHYFPYVGDCNKYWECFRGDRYLYSCPQDLWWNPEILNCDEPGDFCDNSTSVTYPSTTPSPTVIVPTTPGRDPRCTEGGVTYWPQPNDCHKYVQCVDGESFILDCPQNLYFSDRFKQCVRVDESECCLEKECRPGKL